MTFLGYFNVTGKRTPSRVPSASSYPPSTFGRWQWHHPQSHLDTLVILWSDAPKQSASEFKEFD
jgi:hypothetical protein